MLSVSCFLGYFGLDRFLIGDWGKGIIKLLTGGGLGIWYIIDWFLIVRATKRKNMERLEEIINHPLTIILAVLPDIEVR